MDRGTQRPHRAKVVHVDVQNGKPVSIDDFVVGWQLGNGSRWGRPVAVVALPDGSLLISDDAAGRIWRVSYGQ
jgi:glucose/arabinose dehydrogenase